jgi:hypothetical protein
MTFQHWLEDNRAAIDEARAFLQRPVPKDVPSQIETLSKTAQYLALLNDKMADAAGYFREAYAAATADIMSDIAYKNAQPTQIKVLAEGRAGLQKRIYDSLERGSRTATHQIEALRTIISASKAEWTSTQSIR